jgi:predicted component of type VI protein secretion system
MDPSRQPHPEQANFGLRVTVYNEVDGRTTDLLFQQFPIRIGRNPMNDLVLNHQYVSQWHAVFSLGQQGGLTITQVGSSNSVQIGETKLRPSEELPIAGGESIRIVPFTLHVQPVNLPGELPRGSATYQSVIASSSTEDGQALLEKTALKVLDRLSGRFVGRPLEVPRDVAAFGARLEATLGVFFRFFVALQKGQEQFRQALDIKALSSGARNLVETAGDTSELAAYVLGSEGAAPIQALESAFKNIMLHQVALINGLMAGVRSLLARLGPTAITEEASAEHRSPGYRVLWETYERIHKDLSEEDTETFETIFGPQFGKAYANLVGKKAAAK